MNAWQIREDAFDPKKLRVDETIYTIGNGYFGTRGAFEEGYLGATPATLIYGVFDKIPIGKEELANAPDWLPLKLFVNGERFRLDRGKILSFERILDIQKGILTRSVRWESSRGIRLKIDSERFASLADEHVGAIRYTVTAEEQTRATGEIHISLWAVLNTAVGNEDRMHWEAVEQNHEGELTWLQTQTRHSRVQLVQSMSFNCRQPGFEKEVLDSDIAPSIRLQGKLFPGDSVTAEKIVVMYTSRDATDPQHSAFNHLHKIEEQGTQGETPYVVLRAKHEEAWGEFWRQSDVLIEGDDRAEQALRAVRYNLYQLRISASRDDSRYSIAAKGLTGFGYLGHIFHDTEIFMLPFFTFVHPHIARNLLLYRYHLLPAARAKAEHNGYKGAQYPWESTLDGIEATPITIVHPESGELIPVLNGFIELHITSSIAYAVWNHWYMTGDDEFMLNYGAEILLSTAQFWNSRAQYNAQRQDYEIRDVIGPDEWHEHANNNAFTNYMARWNVRTALDILQWLRDTAPPQAEDLIKKIALTEEQVEHMQDVAARLRIPQDPQTGLFEQFDGFFKLAHLDQSKYEGRTTSYQGIMGIEEVQKYQIVKQADVLMLLTVLRDRFDLQTKRVNWEYYYPITDHAYGSSLTPAFHVILACELGYVEAAYKLFLTGALVDIDDSRGNTDAGIHDACAGAVWQAVVFGFAGLRFTEDSYVTRPSWPDGWTRLAFKFMYRGEPVSIDLRR